jgi:hypothetical protein
MPPARHYRLRVFVPYGAGGMSSIMMMSVLDPSHLAMAAVTGVATTVAGLGLGQGWADHRRDEVADAIPLAELTALHHANQALDQVERVLAALGDPTARPPAPRTRRSGMLRRRVPDVPSTVHGPSIAIEKHLLAMIFRAAAVQAIGDLLIDDEQLIALLTGGQIAVETLAGVGEAVFRILAGRVRQDHQERMAQAEARGLPVNHEEMAEQVRAFVEIAAELARMVAANRTNPPSGGAAGGPTGP